MTSRSFVKEFFALLEGTCGRTTVNGEKPMKATGQSKSQQIRARVSHPIIDSDGHTFELAPLFMDYLKSVAGTKVAERFQTAYFDTFADPRWSRFSVEERRERRNLRPSWWAIPARNTTELHTRIFP